VLNYPSIVNVDIGNGNGNCIADMRNGRDKIAEYCGNAGNAGMDRDQLAECLECIYGHNIQYVCSRDNFAMRPESFRIALYDQNQSNTGAPTNLIAINDNTHEQNITAGYAYYLDVNATSYESNASVPGYMEYFSSDGQEGNRSIGYVWDTPKNPASGCLDTSDANATVHFFNGEATIEELKHNQIGIYKFSIIDKAYTSVDWNPNYMKHQQQPHFLSGRDCISGSSISQPEGIATDIASPDLSNVNGCEIASDLTNDTTFTDLAIHLYPYSFYMGGIAPTSGPSDKGFIYIDSPSTQQQYNTNMSYNMNGTYYAAGFSLGGGAGEQLTNFTENCWADDTQMVLSFTYNHNVNTTPFLSYSLQDINTTNPGTIYKPSGGGLVVGTDTNITTPFVIDQEKEFYKTEMRGAITMDLGYNFMRQKNLPLEPRYITFHDFNVTYKINPPTLYADGKNNHIIRGNIHMDRNVTFVYGRAKPNLFLYDNITGNSVTTPVSVVAYCNLGLTACQNRGLASIANGLLEDALSNESNWWIVHNHDSMDGNITLGVSAAGANGSINPTRPDLTGGINESITLTLGNGVPRPATVYVDLVTANPTDTSKYLIFNEDNDSIPSPFFGGRFINGGNWTGHGKTGHVVGEDIDTKKTRRLGW
jgi:hypothetical protein